MFGGVIGGGTEMNDTWEWDSTTSAWTQRSTTGPTIRWGLAMAYDPVTGKAVLQGGGQGGNTTLSTDVTYEWDSSTNLWAARGTTYTPGKRRAHAMVWDSTRSRLVLWGGYNFYGQNYCGDLWERNGTSGQWTQAAMPPRYAHAMVYDPRSGNQRTVMFGGDEYGAPRTDTWTYSGAAGAPWIRQNTATSPGPRTDHAMAYFAGGASPLPAPLMFGGYDGTSYDPTLWRWSGSDWATIGTAGPARRNHGMAYDAARGQLVVFGGVKSGESVTNNETWTWDGTSWTGPLAGGPAARYSMAAAHDTARGVVVFYGGYCDGQGYYNSLYEWDGSWHHPTPGTVPYARDDHAMTFDATLGLTILHGGEYAGSTLVNSWYWDGTVWTMLAEGPNRLRHAMVYDAARQETILYGGEDDASTPQVYDDTWRWTGSAWTRVSSSGPGARTEHAMVFDATRGLTVMVGGANASGTRLGDTWQWDGAAWTQLATSGPPARYHHAMAFDPARRRVVLYGGRGEGGDLLDDTWELHTRGGPCATGATCHTGYCVDEVCCETASCPECQSCNGATMPGVCWSITDGTPCAGGQCWGGSCLPLQDGGLPPDGPPQEDALLPTDAAGDGSLADGPPRCEDAGSADAGRHRRGYVGWGCAFSAAPVGCVPLALVGLILVPLGRRGRRRP